MSSTLRSVNRRMIEGVLDGLLPDPKGLRLVLVHGRYADPETEFVGSFTAGKRQVRVQHVDSVLGIVDAWQHHEHTTADAILVITTSVEDSELGWDIRAHAMRTSTRTVEPAEIVKQRFGAVDLDPRIRDEPWLLSALLEAEPVDGWPRVGGVLTRDSAIRSLIAARTGVRTAVRDGAIDIAALLAWTRTAAAAAYTRLDADERRGIAEWLGEVAGGAASVVLTLAANGRAADVLPLGVLGAVVAADVSREATLAFGGLLGGVLPKFDLLVKAVENTLDRWIDEGVRDSAAARRVLDVVTRADQLAAQVGLSTEQEFSRYLPSSFHHRMRTLASLVNDHRAKAREQSEAALARLHQHALARLLPRRTKVADTAVRLARWLAEPLDPVTGVADGTRRHLAEWGWVDHALAVLWAGDTTHDPVVATAFAQLCDTVRDRRQGLDEAFAQHLRAWTANATADAAGGALVIEDVLARIVVPLLPHRPLVIVLDGMSSAVAVELGVELAQAGWLEATPEAGARAAAVAMIPSVTMVSRVSLLNGAPATGRPAERRGFEKFWRSRTKSARLFYGAEVAGAGGHRLSAEVMQAFEDDPVVAVVLNTIDDALDHGREGDRTTWRLADITYLTELLDTARMYGRAVVLVSDHGHVLERTPGQGPANAEGAESARWRVGTPADGEIELAGPRVRYGDGRVVVPWREDIRYFHEHAGYHGGAALAEMTVPILVLLSTQNEVPDGWAVLPPEDVVPAWWAPRRAAEPEPAPRKRPKEKPAQEVAALFPVETTARPAESVGSRVVASETYQAQRRYVRKPPDNAIVSKIIDALVEGGDTLSLAAVAGLGGRSSRDPQGFATTLERLLKVEGYPVLRLVDDGRTVRLDRALLVEQFGLGAP